MKQGLSDVSRRLPRRLGFTVLTLLLSVPLMGAFMAVIQVVGDEDGLRDVADLELSPGGTQVYAVGKEGDALVVFGRDPSTGRLTRSQLFEDGVNGVFGMLGPSGVAASPDGRHVYATGEFDDTLVVFQRDATPDQLAFVAAQVKENNVGGVIGLDGASAVVVTPDGKHVLVTARADDALSVFVRDASTDDLSFVETHFPASIGPWLDGACAVAVSPDNRHAYVAAEIDDAISLFVRDPQTGHLDFSPQGGASDVRGASSVAISLDGLHVYATAPHEDAVLVFDRDPSTGFLTYKAKYLSRYIDGVEFTEGLEGASDVAIDPSGRRVLVSGRNEDAVAVFRRDSGSGELALLDVVRDGRDVYGLTGADSLTLTQDHAYVAGRDADAIVVFGLPLCYGNEAFGDSDGDDFCDDVDLCLGDDLTGDDDGDGICADLDTCPGFDDAIDADSDGVADGCDNCPAEPNSTQSDFDGDDIGNTCDNCPTVSNPDQGDADDDGIGNSCDLCWGDDLTGDDDGDGICNDLDACPGFNDDLDADGDTMPDACDNCPATPNGNQANSDGDSLGDACDNCLLTDNEDQADLDGDGVGDVCDTPTGVGDRVWLDLDGDGIQDGNEPGVPGVEVALFDLPEPPVRTAGTLAGTTVTDANGYYAFTDISPGTYYLEVNRPSTLFTLPDVGSNDEIDSDIDVDNHGTLAITVDAGEWDGAWDAGLVPGLGDRVWHDLDLDGIQDEGEPGFQGVTVRLLNDALVEVASVVTDFDGGFAFVGLGGGSYVVEVQAPVGYSVSPQSAGGDDAEDSDFDETSGRTSVLAYGDGSLVTTIDAGLHVTPIFADGFESGNSTAWSATVP